MNYITSDGPDTPWNQRDLPEEEIEVTISVTLSKTVKIKVDDYKVNEDADEDGEYLRYDFSECDLYKAVNSQVILPQDLADCKDWVVDDFEIIIE